MNPDHEIELFWLHFKQSMNNFYCNNDFKRPIIEWSDNLNNLQKDKQYELIEKCIKNYISLYGIDLIKYQSNYNLNILKTNIKRWNVIAVKYNFNDNDKKYFNIIFLLIDIYDKLDKKLSNYEFKKFCTEIELLLIYKDFSYLLDLCIKYEMISVLDKINKYIDIVPYFNEKYNIILDKNISGAKIFNYIKNI